MNHGDYYGRRPYLGPSETVDLREVEWFRRLQLGVNHGDSLGRRPCPEILRHLSNTRGDEVLIVLM